jgi:Uma2 family endonuclease
LRRSEINASWLVMPGPGIRLTDKDRPEPDVVVTPADQRLFARQKRDIESGIVAFEVLSPSTKGRDLDWKRAAYASLPSLTHYVAIVQDAVEVVVFARDDDFADRRIRSLAKTIELRSLAISLPVAEIYRDTHLAA